MKVEIEFDTNNAAFEGTDAPEEIARILRYTANRVIDGETRFPIRDVNGNRIGQFRHD